MLKLLTGAMVGATLMYAFPQEGAALVETTITWVSDFATMLSQTNFEERA